MSSDDYFDNDDLDAATLDQLDAIEAALKSPGVPVKPVRHNPPPITKETSFCDLTLDIDDEELQRLDEFIEDTYQGKARPVAGPSKSSSTGTHQTTLFGDILSSQSSTSKPRSQIQRTKSTPRNPFGQQAPKTKHWDQTAFAKTGLKRGKSKGKGKATFDHEDEDEEGEVEFEQFPAPFVSRNLGLLIPLTYSPPPPMKLSPDLLEAKHWIYPLNRPKRDYQYNIVKNCLFENTIVALPTGLGKTFIAGVVMLNYYRWFPDGKVVFVAPTKPLVAQQIDACHQTCGIPGSDAAELTGQIPRAIRGKAWKEKRVFYMTPQTLINDLVTENCDVRDIILIVIDEAHRATGGYAYNQVIRFLMAKNPYFRVLALTATPGSNPEAVQLLIDGLHVSRIDIRDENSLDLKPFIHHKTIKQHIITMTEDIDKVKYLLAKLMDTDMKPLRQRGVLFGSPDPVKMHPYAAQARMSNLNRDQRWAYGPLARLSSLARAMGYLVEGTMGMCYTYLQEVSRDKDDEENAGQDKATASSKSKKLRDDPLFQAIMRELEHQRSRGFSVHPKMDLLKTFIIQHFAENLADERVDERNNDETRAMVFVTFREAVDEIVEALNSESPLVRASKFIGQGTDKQGRKGLAQKEQLEVVKKFKAGEFNVLVATSIGEEGLDIGEVDLIVCYDAQKTPIRMLQRVGRTGRKRAGFVHVLLAEGREELNFDKAKDTHKAVQKTILRGDQLELYADVKRLLPEHIKPACLEKQMEIQEYVRDEGKQNKMDSGRSPTKGTKRKRNDDVLRNIPTGASAGFVSVAELVIKGAKKRAPVVKDLALAGQDDDTDMELESGAVLLPPRRTKSAAVSKPKSRTKLRKASTMNEPKSRKKKIEKVAEPTPSQFSRRGADDEHDLEIGGTGLSFANHAGLEESEKAVDSTHVTDSPTRAIIDLSSSYRDNPTKQDHHQSMAWLIDDDDDPDIEIVDSSPIISRKLPPTRSATNDDSIEFVQPPISPSKFSDSPSWINSMDSEAPRKLGVAAPHTKAQEYSNRPAVSGGRSEDMEVVPDSNSSDDAMTTGSPHALQPPYLKTKDAPKVSRKPAVQPVHQMHSGSEQDIPDASFPVQPIVKQRKWPRIEQELSSSPILVMPPPSQRRLHRRHESPTQRRLRKQNRSKPISRPNPLLFDAAAIHSGDETSEGSSDLLENDFEDESDRLFLQPMAETQLSPSYDQTLAYRQSLFTQAPAGSKAPVFGNRPVRNGMFRIGDTSSRRRSFVPSSPSNGEPDEYAFGSFVVDDEAEISYLSSE